MISTHFTTTSHIENPLIQSNGLQTDLRTKCILLATDLQEGKIATVEDFLYRIIECYPDSVDSYTTFSYTSPTPGNKGQHDEAKRTLMSFAAFYWVYTRDYASFIKGQPKPELEFQQFENLHNEYKKIYSTPELLHLKFALLELHDIGKVERFQMQIKDLCPDFEGFDHDAFLLKAFDLHAENRLPQGILPKGFYTLDAYEQKKIHDGWKMQMLIGQVTQLESPAASISGFIHLRNQDPEAAKFYINHERIDVQGALGNRDLDLVEEHGRYYAIPKQGSFLYNQGLCQAHDLLTTSLFNESLSSPTQIYSDYAEKRAQMAGFSILDEKTKTMNPKDIFLIRLIAMNRFFKDEEVIQTQELVRFLLESSNPHDALLLEELTNTGCDGKKAILPYYGPQMFVNIRSNQHFAAIATLDKMLVGCRLMAKIFETARNSFPQDKQEGNGILSINFWEICIAINQEKDFDSLLKKEIIIDPKTLTARFI